LILGRMAASVAHEVRNPLHTLRLVVDELRVEQPALHTHPLSVHIDDSLERIDRAVDLVYQLARPGTDDDGAGDMVSALREAQKTRSLQLQNRVITYHELPENAAVRCSASSLRIIIDNLLRNAVQATTEGDTISVTLRCDHHRWILRIRNPGTLPTLPTTHRDALPAASHKEDGLGLGLTITRQLASNADGNLELISDEGFVTAELTLPMWQDSTNALTKENPT
jgi:signal transduction histidine kinase